MKKNKINDGFLDLRSAEEILGDHMEIFFDLHDHEKMIYWKEIFTYRDLCHNMVRLDEMVDHAITWIENSTLDEYCDCEYYDPDDCGCFEAFFDHNFDIYTKRHHEDLRMIEDIMKERGFKYPTIKQAYIDAGVR